jgi:hypothetical protein
MIMLVSPVIGLQQQGVSVKAERTTTVESDLDVCLACTVQQRAWR